MTKIKLNGRYLPELIVRRGDTVTSFANSINLTKQGLGQIINGKINPSPPTAKKICTLLGCKFDDIFITSEN